MVETTLLASDGFTGTTAFWPILEIDFVLEKNLAPRAKRADDAPAFKALLEATTLLDANMVTIALLYVIFQTDKLVIMPSIFFSCLYRIRPCCAMTLNARSFSILYQSVISNFSDLFFRFGNFDQKSIFQFLSFLLVSEASKRMAGAIYSQFPNRLYSEQGAAERACYI